ncbi:MAG: S41 family peptidase, partial [Planctomycetes bacterium]|nr:S41 family peptidase [Planctomycetota bacterium]
IEAGGKKISPQNIDEISSLVKGEPGSTVELKVIRNELQDTIQFNLVREEVIVKNVTYSGFYPENSNNVYLKLSNFSRSASDEIKKTIKELKDQKQINSIVFDLRGNPGGLLSEAYLHGVNNLAEAVRLIRGTSCNQPENVATYSPKLAECNRELKGFLFQNFYRHYRVVRMAAKAERLLQELFRAYVALPEQLPPEVQMKVTQRPEDLYRIVCDYLAGMTDRYAILEHKRLFDYEERA